MNRELPKGWEWKKLEEVCEKPEYGYTTRAKPDGHGPLFLRTTDISNEGINWKSVPFCFEPPSNEERYILKEGDLLIARAGSVGESVVIKNPPRAVFASYLIRFRPKRELLDALFAGFFLKSVFFWAQLGGKTTGTTLPGVNASNLSKVKIPLPSLEIQRKIVTILEKAEGTKKFRAQADELTIQLHQSTFFDMFGDSIKNPKGWKIIRFNDIISDTKNGLYKPDKYYGKGIPILRMYNIKNTRIIMENYHRIDVTDKEYEDYKLVEGDILFNRVNSPIWLGKAAVIPNGLGKCIYESKNIRIRLKKELANPTYIVYYLSTPAGKNQIIKHTKPAVNQATVNNDDLRKFEIMLPPLSLQKNFAKIVENVETLREIQKQSRKENDDLFNTLTQKAFTGELIT